jgi:hypothetical protein
MHRNLWIKLAKIWGQVGGGQLAVGGRDPPLGRFGGGDCGGTKHLQKKFFKKVTTNANCAKMSTPQTTELKHENEAGNSHNQRPRVDRLRH